MRSLRLDAEATRETWGDPSGWVLSGLRVTARRAARVGIELWTPQVSSSDPQLWCELDLEPERPTEVIVGCEHAAPYRVRVVRRTEAEPQHLAGGLLPERCRVRLPDLAAAWGGRAMALVDGWQDQGFSTERHDLGTSCTFATASWNGRGTWAVAHTVFDYPEPVIRGSAVVLEQDEHTQRLARTPLVDWPEPVWLWCVVRDKRR
jgi:hypothetical protein